MKLKAYKLFENSDADLSWLLFLKKPTCDKTWIHLDAQNGSHFNKMATKNGRHCPYRV